MNQKQTEFLWLKIKKESREKAFMKEVKTFQVKTTLGQSTLFQL